LKVSQAVLLTLFTIFLLEKKIQPRKKNLKMLNYTVKKLFDIPVPSRGMSLTKLSMGEFGQ
jgi:hypothetical protein